MHNGIIPTDQSLNQAASSYSKALQSRSDLTPKEQFQALDVFRSISKITTEKTRIELETPLLRETVNVLGLVENLINEIEINLSSGSSNTGGQYWSPDCKKLNEANFKNLVNLINTKDGHYSVFFKISDNIVQLPDSNMPFEGIPSYTAAPTVLPLHPVFGQTNIFENDSISNLFQLYIEIGSEPPEKTLEKYITACQNAKDFLSAQTIKLNGFIGAQDRKIEQIGEYTSSLIAQLPEKLRNDIEGLAQHETSMAEAQTALNEATRNRALQMQAAKNITEER